MHQEPSANTDLKVGQLVMDRYEIASIIGRGGMGVVYRARHVLMNRWVAIKMIRPELVANTSLMQRFQQEAMAVSKLDHPNIVSVYDFGILPEGAPYLVMDYLDGISLSDLILKEGAIGLNRAIPLFIQAGMALEHAHRNGIIHRDFKSSNIMICRGADNIEVVKVVDFGMAKFARPESDDKLKQEITHSGEIFGSPLYMSPEHCRGLKLDERSDIYSLGCVMYYGLTGRPVFLGENVFDTLQKQINEDPQPVSTWDAKIPQTLDEVVLKALRKDPDLRYATMSELLYDLEAVVYGKARLSNTQEIKKKNVPRKRFISHNFETHLSLAAALAVVVVAFSAFFWGRAFEEGTASNEANAWVERNLDGDRCRREGDLTAAETYYNEALTESLKFGKNDPRQAKSLFALGTTYAQDHRFDKAQNALRRARTILEACYGPECPELSPVLLALSQTYDSQGNTREAQLTRDEAMRLFQQSASKPPSIIRSRAKLADNNKLDAHSVFHLSPNITGGR